LPPQLFVFMLVAVVCFTSLQLFVFMLSPLFARSRHPERSEGSLYYVFVVAVLAAACFA
jgi:hypothetical protein